MGLSARNLAPFKPCKSLFQFKALNDLIQTRGEPLLQCVGAKH